MRTLLNQKQVAITVDLNFRRPLQEYVALTLTLTLTLTYRGTSLESPSTGLSWETPNEISWSGAPQVALALASTSMLLSRHASSVRISRIRVFQMDLPLHEAAYKWAGGKSVATFDATLVKVETDVPGLSGWGEVTPLGSAYLASFAAGARAGLRELAPKLLGLNPLEITAVNLVMDRELKGHGYVKSPIDVALHDIVGKAFGCSVSTLLGGVCSSGGSVPLYRAISQDTPDNMVRNVDKFIAEGYRRFQLKVGSKDVDGDIARIRMVRALLDERSRQAGEPSMLLMCDANTGWRRDEALRVINGCRDLDVYIEQPCASYEECRDVRRSCPLPMILDECIDDVGSLVRAAGDGACDMINLKISKVGGLSKARALRDLACSLGVPMNIEDTWGGDIVTCAISHLAASCPPAFLVCATDFNSYGPVTMGETSARRRGGLLRAPTEPGLGIKVDEAALESRLQFEVA